MALSPREHLTLGKPPQIYWASACPRARAAGREAVGGDQRSSHSSSQIFLMEGLTSLANSSIFFSTRCWACCRSAAKPSTARLWDSSALSLAYRARSRGSRQLHTRDRQSP